MLITNGKGVRIFISEFKNVRYILEYFTKSSQKSFKISQQRSAVTLKTQAWLKEYTYKWGTLDTRIKSQKVKVVYIS